MELIWVPSSTSYLQAGRTTLGMWANTIEKGATFIEVDEFTYIGSKGGMSPDEFTVNMFPFSRMVWLCKFPSFAVRWYSSLAVSRISRRSSWTRSIFVLWELCLWCKLQVPLKTTSAWMLVLLSRLINNNTIPFCMMKNIILFRSQTEHTHLFRELNMDATYRIFCTVSISTYLLCPRKACWQNVVSH